MRQAELGVAANGHTLRATGITAKNAQANAAHKFLLNGGSLKNAQANPCTTKLYDRTASPN